MKHAGRGPRRLPAITVGAVTLTLGLAACATGTKPNLTPPQAVQQAISKVGSQSNIELSFSLPLSRSQIEQLKSGGSAPTATEAQAISTGSVFLKLATGHGEALDSTQAQTDSQTSFDLGLTIGNDTPVELSYVDQNIFLHVDAAQLLSDTGQPASDAQKFSSELTKLDTYVPGLSALGQGKWVEVTHTSLQSLSPLLKEAEGAVPGGAAFDASAFKTAALKLRTEILAAIQANSTIASVGSSGGGDEYSVTANISGFVNTVTPEIQSTLSSIPGFSSQASSAFAKAKSALPAGQSAVVDVYVQNGTVTRAEIDVNQFKHQYSFPVPVRVDISSPGAPSAPSGATALDLSKLPTLIGQLLGSLGSHSSDSSSTSTTG